MFDIEKEYSDLARTAAIDWSKLEGKSILITGATGLIGSCCIRLLLERNRISNRPIHVIALVRNLEKANKLFSEYSKRDDLEFVVSDLESFDRFDAKCDFVIHAGCPTASNYFINHPVETAASIVQGTFNMLELAKYNKVDSFVYVSSMEIYGDGNNARGLENKLKPENVGYVNPLNMRSSYPEGKRMAEFLVAAFFHEYGVHTKCARLAQTFGPGIPLNDNRVFAQFARCAIEKKDIVLRTTGESTRMYNYTTDAVVALITILLEGKDGISYNVANESTYSSVREMAELVASECADGEIAVRLEIDPDAPYPPEHHLPLDTSDLQLLGWKPKLDLDQMYCNLIAYLSK